MCFIVLHEKSERRASSASFSLAFWTDTGSLFCILDRRLDCGKFRKEMGKNKKFTLRCIPTGNFNVLMIKQRDMELYKTSNKIHVYLCKH